MIVSNAKINQLLEIFSPPKIIYPYNNLIEKQDMKNAITFINNYHKYGPPINYTNSINQSNVDVQKNEILKEPNILSCIITNKTQNLIDPKEIDIKTSITNLRLGQTMYKKEKEKNDKINISKRNIGIYNSNNLYQNSILYSQNNNNIINSYNQDFLMSIYNNNKELFNSKLYNNQNSIVNSQIGKIKSLNDIPSNPEDVEIKDLPPNYSQIMNPISSSNINMMNIPITQNRNANIQPITEEINTNIIPEDEIPHKNIIEEQNNISEVQEEAKFEELQVEPHQKTGKYKITAFNGPIRLPENYSTDDVDEYNAIQMINDDISTWKLQIDKPNYKIYSKPFKTINEKGEEGESRMFYLNATIDAPASEVNRQINTFQLRKKWEESLKKGKLIKEENFGNGIKTTEYYGYIKMPLIFADRDIVVRKKIWEDYNGEKDCCLNEIHSIEDPDFPAKEKPVRAILQNKSKYIKPIDGNRTKFYYVNKFDMKISLGGSMMESKGAAGTEKWFKAFLKQLEK